MNPAFWAARKSKRLSHKELADLIHTDQTFTRVDVSRIEVDGWVPPPAIQAALAQVLEAPVEDLFPPQSVAS